MKRIRVRLVAVLVVIVSGLAPAVIVPTPATALSDPTIPWLTLNRTITSQPWGGSTTKAFDLEGSAYLHFDHTLWVVDDQRDAAYEIDPVTGKLLHSITQASFAGAKPFGGTAPLAGTSRADSFSSVAYDLINDTLYIFSGNCCGVAPFDPAVFRLTRNASGVFTVDSYQPLPEGTDASAAGVVLGGKLYFGKGQKIRTYDYATNTIGANITITGAGTAINGMAFADPDTDTMLVTTADNTLVKVDAATWSAVPGWNFDLAPFGILNPTSVEVVGDRLFITDGYDARPAGDPLKYAIFVLDLAQAPPVTASFEPHVTRGASPLLVWFIDHSIRADTHAWNFGDGATSTETNPVHIYTAAGTYTATLTVTGVGGSSTTQRTITVLPATARTGGYTLDGFGGLHPFQVGNSAPPPAAKGGPYWKGWDIARGVAVLADGSGGYTLDGFGGLQPFQIGTSAPPLATKSGPYWNGWDAARGVALMPDGSGGYLVDLFGGIHRFSIGAGPLPPTPDGGPYWKGQDQARGITILPDGSGGYIVDRVGYLHAFRIGTNAPPAAPTGVWSGGGSPPVQGVSLLPTGTGGYTIDGFGTLHRFALTQTPPLPIGLATWFGWDIARDVAVMPGN